MKVRITSLFLATIMLVSTTGCSLSKKNNDGNINPSTSITQESPEYNLQNRMIEFIETIENSDVNIDLTNFYNNARTLQIVYEQTGEMHYNSFYDKDKNTIVVNLDSPGAFEHELIHVIFNNGKELNNVFIEEGITELLASELCNAENTYRFNVGIVKILATILGRDKVMECINKKDINILNEGLANIVPAVSDAEEFMRYLVQEHGLNQKMHQEFFNEGNLDNFKKTEEYEALKSYRRNIIGRIKIYIKNYYINKVREEGINPEAVLTEMLSLLDVVNLELFDPDIEGELSNDFFLQDEVSYLMNTYKLTDKEYDKCYENSKVRTYLVGSTGNVNKKSLN